MSPRLSSYSLAACLSCCAFAIAQNAVQQREVRSLNELPPEVLAFLIQDPPQGIADRGGKSNVTDVVDQTLPMRRFVLAVITPVRLVVEVERGGRSHYFQKLEFHQVYHHWMYQARNYLDGKIDDVATLLR